MILYEQLYIGNCPLCGTNNWLWFADSTDIIACGKCTMRLANTRIVDDGASRRTRTQRRMKRIVLM